MLSFSLIFTAFLSGVVAAPALQSVFVTNFPLDSKGSLKTSGNVTVTTNLPSKRIILFEGDLIGFGYGINQTRDFAGTTSDNITLARSYFNPDPSNFVTLTQFFKIFVNATINLEWSMVNLRSGQTYHNSQFTVTPPFTPTGVSICCFLAPGTNNVEFTFTLRSGPVHGSIAMLDTFGGQLALGEINATGFRKLTLHSSVNIQLPSMPLRSDISASLFDPFSQATYSMTPIQCSIPCVIGQAPTYSIDPPFDIRVSFNGFGDFPNLKIVAYLWN